MRVFKQKKLLAAMVCLMIGLTSFITGINIRGIANAKAAETNNISGTSNGYEYLTGHTSLIQDQVSIETEETAQIILPSYVFYYVTDGSGLNYYVADVASIGSNYLDYGINSVRIFDKDTQVDFYQLEEFVDVQLTDNYVLELQYYVKDRNFLYTIYSVISREIYETVTSVSQDLVLTPESNDTLSLRLKESIEFEYLFKLSLAKEEEKQISPRLISVGSRDVMDYDGLIKEYYDLYEGKNHYSQRQGRATSDDPIVNILPKDSFMKSNVSRLRIGKEYGYYFRTTAVNTDDLIYECLVFDIENQLLSPNYFEGIISVAPLFGGKYYYDRSEDLLTRDVRYGGFGTNLALANIQIDAGMSNINAPNLGDEGYDFNKDMGYCFGSYDFSAYGIGRNRDMNTFDATILKTIVKKIKYIKGYTGIVNEAFSFIEWIDQTISEKPYLDRNLTLTADKELVAKQVIFQESNLYLFIKKYHFLPKALSISINNQSVEDGCKYPLLYKPYSDTHKFQVNYRVLQRNDDINQDTQLTVGITLDIVEDNSGRNALGIPYGQVDYIATDSYATSEEFNRIPKAGRPTIDMNENTVYKSDLIEGIFQEYRFTPNETRRYIFETLGDDRTQLTLYDFNKNLLAVKNGGGYGNNTRLAYSLTASKTYYIKLDLYDGNPIETACGSTRLFIRREPASLLVESKRSINLNTQYHGSVIWRTFKPTEAGIYTFTAVSGNTYLELYDQSFNRLAFNNDSRYGGINAVIDMYLKAGEEYHVRVSFASVMTGGNISLIVNRMQTVIFTEEDRTFEDFSLTPNGYVYYRVMPKDSGYCSMGTDAYTTYKNTGITLYDADFNYLASNSGGGKNGNCLLRYNLSSYKTYYIRINTVDTTNTCKGTMMFVWG